MDSQTMSTHHPKPTVQGLQLGLALPMLLLALLMVSALGLETIRARQTQAASRQEEERTARLELQHLRQALLAHATLKGMNSHTHAGNLPCPAPNSTGVPPATCLNAWMGYLPTEARSAVNHLRLGLDTQPNPGQRQAEKSWMYAVSPQVIQPNTLGWSQWVDWSKTPLTVDAEGQRFEQVVAVIAQGLRTVGAFHVEAEPPYILLGVNELQTEISRNQLQLAQSTVSQWLEQAGHVGVNEHLLTSPQTGKAQPHWPACSCQCAQTRCTCQCAGESWWASNANCIGNTDRCKAPADWGAQPNPQALPQGLPSQRLCHAAAGESCVFAGPARLWSAWPVSSTLPVAASGKACQQFRGGVNCPTSPSGTACVCEFNWPSMVQSALPNLRVDVNTGRLEHVD